MLLLLAVVLFALVKWRRHGLEGLIAGGRVMRTAGEVQFRPRRSVKATVKVVHIANAKTPVRLIFKISTPGLSFRFWTYAFTPTKAVALAELLEFALANAPQTQERNVPVGQVHRVGWGPVSHSAKVFVTGRIERPIRLRMTALFRMATHRLTVNNAYLVGQWLRVPVDPLARAPRSSPPTMPPPPRRSVTDAPAPRQMPGR